VIEGVKAMLALVLNAKLDSVFQLNSTLKLVESEGGGGDMD
jgi:hypothetical protein